MVVNAHAMPPRREGPLPPFARAIDALAAALPALSAGEKLKPSQVAERYRFVRSNGSRVAWRNSVAPYMVEPMDMSDSRRFRAMVFVGPARSVKSEALLNNVILHRARCRPRDVRIIASSEKLAREYSISKLDAMIQDTPALKERMLPGRNANSLYDKRFAGGMRVTIEAAVGGAVAMVEIPDMLGTEYDLAPEDIGGEGSLFELMRTRTRTFGTLGMTIVESSPRKPILDEGFRAPADAPHLAPPTVGILALYNTGTRARRYWPCEACGRLFEPDFACLVYPDKGDPYERGRGAVLACPYCGGIHEQARRRHLDAEGVWLHEGPGGKLVRIDDDVRETEIVSYWLKGPNAVFQSWPQLVGKYLAALETFGRTGDESLLKTTINVDQALPYLPKGYSADTELTADVLRTKPAAVTAKTVPAEARFLTASVDVQGNRFVVQIDAWGVGLERWMIDRFDVHQPPAEAPNAEGRAIAPPLYAEDWAALDLILSKVYPVEGSGRGLVPCALIVDSGGAPGTTQNAYKWWRRTRKVAAKRAFLVRPVGGVDRQPRAVLREPDEFDRRQRRKGAPTRVKPKAVEMVFAATDVLKDEVAVSLLRKAEGPGAFHLAGGLPPEVFGELAAERRTPDGWEKKAGQVRNEALDCSVYGKALVIVLGGETIDWARPPAWAAPIEANAWAVEIEDPAAAPERARGVSASAPRVVAAAVASPAVAAAQQPVPVVAARPAGRRVRSGGI